MALSLSHFAQLLGFSTVFLYWPKLVFLSNFVNVWLLLELHHLSFFFLTLFPLMWFLNRVQSNWVQSDRNIYIVLVEQFFTSHYAAISFVFLLFSLWKVDGGFDLYFLQINLDNLMHHSYYFQLYLACISRGN